MCYVPQSNARSWDTKCTCQYVTGLRKLYISACIPVPIEIWWQLCFNLRQLSIALRVSINGHRVSINQCIFYFCLGSSCVNLNWVFHWQGQLSRCHLCRATFYARASVQWGEVSAFLLSGLSWSDFLQCGGNFLCLFCRHTHTTKKTGWKKIIWDKWASQFYKNEQERKKKWSGCIASRKTWFSVLHNWSYKFWHHSLFCSWKKRKILCGWNTDQWRVSCQQQPLVYSCQAFFFSSLSWSGVYKCPISGNSHRAHAVCLRVQASKAAPSHTRCALQGKCWPLAFSTYTPPLDCPPSFFSQAR